MNFDVRLVARCSASGPFPWERVRVVVIVIAVVVLALTDRLTGADSGSLLAELVRVV